MRWLTEPLATPRLVVRGVSGDGLTALLLVGLAFAGCAGRKDTSGDADDSSSEVDPCVNLMSDDTVIMIPTSGDTPNLIASEESGDRWCQPGFVCRDSYILPSSLDIFVPSSEQVPLSTLIYINPDGRTTQSMVADNQTFFERSSTDSGSLAQVMRPVEALAPSTQYEVWRQFEDSRTGEQSTCFDLTLVTSPHGSPLSLPASPLPPMQILASDLRYTFAPYIFEGLSSSWPDEGGPDYAIHFGEIIDGLTSVRVAAMAGSEQSWCHATLDTVVAVDDNGRFQIPGVPWRGLGTGNTDPVHGSELQNLLAEPFTISGYLAPDGQNAIVTLDDVVLDYRLAGKGCDLNILESFDVKCSDGEICCMDVSTGPTITTTFPLHTSIQQIAQDNCHPRCPTSADNPDCTLP